MKVFPWLSLFQVHSCHWGFLTDNNARKFISSMFGHLFKIFGEVSDFPSNIWNILTERFVFKLRETEHLYLSYIFSGFFFFLPLSPSMLPNFCFLIYHTPSSYLFHRFISCLPFHYFDITTFLHRRKYKNHLLNFFFRLFLSFQLLAAWNQERGWVSSPPLLQVRRKASEGARRSMTKPGGDHFCDGPEAMPGQRDLFFSVV